MWEKLKDVVLYIPRKIMIHFDNYKFLEEKYAEYQGFKKACDRRMNCIKLEAERNSYGNFGAQKRKIIELATTPIENKF